MLCPNFHLGSTLSRRTCGLLTLIGDLMERSSCESLYGDLVVHRVLVDSR